MASPPNAPSLYPAPSAAALKAEFIGKRLQDIQAPAAVIDAAAVRHNCKLMLEAARKLGVGFRGHVKTHKTTEITKLEVGEAPLPVKLIASTVSEIQHLLPWLLECRREGREVNVLYGLPVAPSAIPRLARVASILGEGTISLFADHPAHVALIDSIPESVWPGRVPVFVNIDVGDHREGVAPGSKQLADIASALKAASKVRLAGLYAYLGKSYSSNSPQEALGFLAQELQGLQAAASSLGVEVVSPSATPPLTLSIGTTPTATALQNILDDTATGSQCRALLAHLSKAFAIELHAGVHTLLDLQQLATQARPANDAKNNTPLLSPSALSLRILAEVSSLYPDRGSKPEALVAAGTLALGREPCKSYAGWAVVSPWCEDGAAWSENDAPWSEKAVPGSRLGFYDPAVASPTGWIVSRVSQEHGVLTWEGPREGMRELRLGEKVLLWPNHACIASAGFGWYVVVDSEEGDGDVVRDVWVRWRGW